VLALAFVSLFVATFYVGIMLAATFRQLPKGSLRSCIRFQWHNYSQNYNYHMGKEIDQLKLELASLKSQLASQTSDLAKVKNQLADMNIQIGYLEMGSNERVASSTVETVPRCRGDGRASRGLQDLPQDTK
jgi:hypothetical protein